MPRTDGSAARHARRRSDTTRCSATRAEADLQGRILGQTLALAAVGMAIGTAASWLLSRAFSGMLFGVTATDPATFLGMLAVLTIVSAVAGYIPARRASRLDPMLALRAD